MNWPTTDCVDAVATMIELETDVMWRYLIDRDTLSASAALVINRLHSEGPMRLTALAEAEGSSQSGMTQLVQRLERLNLLERWSDPDDGRASLVMLGDAGRRNWEARAALRRERLAGMLSTVSADDRVALWLAAQVVNNVLGRVREGARSGQTTEAEVGG